MNLFAGPQFAGLPYLVLGSASGDTPGFAIDGQLLPLNLDSYTDFTLLSPNVPPLKKTSSPISQNPANRAKPWSGSCARVSSAASSRA